MIKLSSPTAVTVVVVTVSACAAVRANHKPPTPRCARPRASGC